MLTFQQAFKVLAQKGLRERTYLEMTVSLYGVTRRQLTRRGGGRYLSLA